MKMKKSIRILFFNCR